MICVEKKYFSCFELINTHVLVNSSFLLEREKEREKERETQAYTNPILVHAHTYTPVHIKTPSLINLPGLLFRSDQTANRRLFMPENRGEQLSPVRISAIGRTVVRHGGSFREYRQIFLE
jgi:hypothetical protein